MMVMSISSSFFISCVSLSPSFLLCLVLTQLDIFHFISPYLLHLLSSFLLSFQKKQKRKPALPSRTPISVLNDFFHTVLHHFDDPTQLDESRMTLKFEDSDILSASQIHDLIHCANRPDGQLDYEVLYSAAKSYDHSVAREGEPSTTDASMLTMTATSISAPVLPGQAMTPITATPQLEFNIDDDTAIQAQRAAAAAAAAFAQQQQQQQQQVLHRDQQQALDAVQQQQQEQQSSTSTVPEAGATASAPSSVVVEGEEGSCELAEFFQLSPADQQSTIVQLFTLQYSGQLDATQTNIFNRLQGVMDLSLVQQLASQAQNALLQQQQQQQQEQQQLAIALQQQQQTLIPILQAQQQQLLQSQQFLFTNPKLQDRVIQFFSQQQAELLEVLQSQILSQEQQNIVFQHFQQQQQNLLQELAMQVAAR